MMKSKIVALLIMHFTLIHAMEQQKKSMRTPMIGNLIQFEEDETWSMRQSKVYGAVVAIKCWLKTTGLPNELCHEIVKYLIYDNSPFINQEAKKEYFYSFKERLHIAYEYALSGLKEDVQQKDFLKPLFKDPPSCNPMMVIRKGNYPELASVIREIIIELRMGYEGISNQIFLAKKNKEKYLPDREKEIKEKSIMPPGQAFIYGEDYFCIHNSLDLMIDLIESGLNPNTKDPVNYSDASENGNTVMHLVAVGADDTKALEVAIAYGGNVNEKNDINETPLVIAALSGNSKGCQLLIDHGAKQEIGGCSGSNASLFFELGSIGIR